MSVILLIIFATLTTSTPLLFSALGGMVNERSGVVNIGLEGIMTFGAFAGTISVTLTEAMIPGLADIIYLSIGFFVTCITGILVGVIYALFTVSFKINQTIMGVALNLIAIGICGFFVSVLYGRPDTPNIQAHRITFLDNEVFLISIIGFLCVIILYFLFKYLLLGKYIDSVGENPQAADAMGLSVVKIRYQALIISGILSAIGGFSIVLTTTSKFNISTVSGLGFIALAVMLFGNRKPINILFAALIFGLFTSSSTVIGVIYTDLAIPNVVFEILPYVLTIVVLIIFAKSSKDPSALGQVYDKELR